MGSGSADPILGMPKIGTPMLFSPPEAPLALHPRGTVVLGRSRSCDLRIGGSDASRRHAEILGDPDGFLLRDLGSTNGTFVNGAKITKQFLRDGDEVRIGEARMKFSLK